MAGLQIAKEKTGYLDLFYFTNDFFFHEMITFNIKLVQLLKNEGPPLENI